MESGLSNGGQYLPDAFEAAMVPLLVEGKTPSAVDVRLGDSDQPS